MIGLRKEFIKDKNKRRKNSDASDNSDQNTFGHYQAHVPAKGKTHEAQGDETGDGGNTAAGDRLEGGLDGVSHGPVVISSVAADVFVVTVPQENGIVQRHTQLQDRGDGLCDI